ncbi:60Kd inner membrane protein-domain-containing protein [Cytidiella melzeri]|nr:60Kd inner membrane protein-domain-containing protein [Cytidiella melzeri]
MMRAAVSGTGKRVGFGKRFPRHVASPESVLQGNPLCLSFLTTCQPSQLLRPHALRQGFLTLPGGARNISFWSSKTSVALSPAPATPESIPPETLAHTLQRSAVQQSSAIPQASDTVPPDVSIVPDTADTLLDTITSVPADAVASIPPLQYGDLAAAGLTGWFPPGLWTSAMEFAHIYAGLPWFWVIVGASVLTRVVLLPFTVMSLRNAVKIAENKAELDAVTSQVKLAFASKNQIEIQRATLAQRALFNRIGVSPAKQLGPMFVQLPVTFGFFLAVKRMCELPVVQLQTSGIAFLSDLTVPDPTWILPILSAAVINVQISLSARDMATSAMVPHMINVMRVFSIALVFVCGNWPAGTQLSVLCGALALVVQTSLLRIPAIKRILNLPQRGKNIGNKTVSILESVQAARNFIQEQSAAAKKKTVPPPSLANVRMKTKKRR